MYTRKSLLELWVFFEQSLSPGFGLFFWLSVGGKLSLFFFGEKLSPGVLDLVNFFQINNFSFFEKMLWGSGAIFLRLLGSHRENKSMKEFVCFSTTDVFVPVSQLSTRDLFDFLGNLKIKQDIFFLSWISRRVRSVEQRALWYPYSRLSFGIVFKRMLFLEYFYRVNCSVDIRFWHISFQRDVWIIDL